MRERFNEVIRFLMSGVRMRAMMVRMRVVMVAMRVATCASSSMCGDARGGGGGVEEKGRSFNSMTSRMVTIPLHLYPLAIIVPCAGAATCGGVLVAASGVILAGFRSLRFLMPPAPALDGVEMAILVRVGRRE